VIFIKKRYLLLPLILISLIILIIDLNNNKITKNEIKNNNIEIYYPSFNNKKIDNNISKYINTLILNYYLYENDNLVLDYNMYYEKDKYIILFNGYFSLDNKQTNIKDTFYVDLNYNQIVKYK